MLHQRVRLGELRGAAVGQPIVGATSAALLGDAIGVGEGQQAAEPARVLINDVVYDVVAWAGPWPVEECWWDQRRARRTVRLQLLVRDVGSLSVTRAMIAVLERSVWRLAAWYA